MKTKEQTIPALQFGDLAVLAQAQPPAKMVKALAAIAARAHPAYDECSGDRPGASKDKCLFMSLAVRDFLVEIGFADATVRGCFLYVAAQDSAGKDIWSVGIGAPGAPDVPNKFNGHAVCTVPSLSLLIDTTIYQAIRPHWSGSVGGMAAISYHRPWPRQLMWGCPSIAGCENVLADRKVLMMWLDRPDLNWRRQPDFRHKNDRRRYVSTALREAFGKWT